MTITLEWLNNQRTEQGGFTQLQVEALGLSWPPAQGWLKRQIGRDIPFEMAYEFERWGRRHQSTLVE